MADIAAVVTRPDNSTKLVFWEQINADDEGASLFVQPGFADKTLIAQGTFNGGTYSLECSADGIVFVDAVDAQGDPVEMTAAGSVLVASDALFWRIANDNAGTAEDVDIYLVCVLG